MSAASRKQTDKHDAFWIARALHPEQVRALRAQIEGWTRDLEIEPSALAGE